LEDRLKLLKRFGLTNYQAKAYLTLIIMGEGDAKSISRTSGIPYAKIHSTLLSLIKDGWIITVEGRPRRYKAKPPIEIVNEKINRGIEEMKIQGEKIIRELQPIYEKAGFEEKSEVMILRGIGIILERTVNSIRKVNKTLRIALTGKIFKAHKELIDILLSNLKKKVDVKILLDEELKDYLEILSKYGFKGEVGGEMFGGGIIVDEDEAIILLGEILGSPMAIWSNNKVLTNIAKIYFEYLWEMRKPKS
jgi:sugar-specific transcriptional regulator TrmB